MKGLKLQGNNGVDNHHCDKYKFWRIGTGLF